MNSRFILLLTFFALFVAGITYAYAQTIRLSGSDVQVYDGGTWRSLGNVTLGSCAGTANGTMRYNSGSARMEFCNGTNWMSMDSGVNAGSCAGTPAGTFRYSGGFAQFCNGTNWRNGYTLAVTGVCNNTSQNGCTAGSANDGAVADSSTYFYWRCDGSGGGANSGTCQYQRPGSCGSAASGAAVASQPISSQCSTGTFSDTPADNTSYWRWTCTGNPNSGTCQRARLTVVNGVCNNSVQNGCSAGTANDGAIADTSTEYRWRCDGSGGGSNSGTCSKAKPYACSGGTYSQNGCGGTLPNTYTVGQTGTVPCGTGCSGTFNYQCDGIGAWIPAAPYSCVTPVVNGACGVANGSEYSGAPPAGELCASGTASSAVYLVRLSAWRWSCAGSGGGSTATGCVSIDTSGGGGSGCFCSSSMNGCPPSGPPTGVAELCCIDSEGYQC